MISSARIIKISGCGPRERKARWKVYAPPASSNARRCPDRQSDVEKSIEDYRQRAIEEGWDAEQSLSAQATQEAALKISSAASSAPILPTADSIPAPTARHGRRVHNFLLGVLFGCRNGVVEACPSLRLPHFLQTGARCSIGVSQTSCTPSKQAACVLQHTRFQSGMLSL